MSAPTVVLEVDHVTPISAGGTNDVLNLVTACFDCNRGKGKKRIDDVSATTRRIPELSARQERLEQIQMLERWYRELGNADREILGLVCRYWEQRCPGWAVNNAGRSTIDKHLRKFGPDVLFEAMRRSADQYIEWCGETDVTEQSWDTAFNKIGAICNTIARYGTNAPLDRLLYVRGIARNRFADYPGDDEAMSQLVRLHESGLNVDDLHAGVLRSASWTEFGRVAPESP